MTEGGLLISDRDAGGEAWQAEGSRNAEGRGKQSSSGARQEEVGEGRGKMGGRFRMEVGEGRFGTRGGEAWQAEGSRNAGGGGESKIAAEHGRRRRTRVGGRWGGDFG